MNKRQNNESVMHETELMKRIKALSFAATEAQLFLDTHPECTSALEYYRDVVARLNEAMAEYSATHSPILAAQTNGDSWSWAGPVWPWHTEV